MNNDSLFIALVLQIDLPLASEVDAKVISIRRLHVVFVIPLRHGLQVGQARLQRGWLGYNITGHFGL